MTTSVLIATWCLALMSPGLDFAIVTQNTLRKGMRAGIHTALGVALGLSVHFVYTAIFLGAVFKDFHWLIWGLQIMGGLFLIYVGYGVLQQHLNFFFRVKASSTSTPSGSMGRTSWGQGFLTNMLNPKVGVLSISLFTPYVKIHPKHMMYIVFGIFVLVTALWFSFIALCWSRPWFANMYQRHQVKIDVSMGAFFVALGAHVICQVF